MNFRIGHGYDVHRLVECRDLILGGVHIPHHLGLLGHSDADVVLHAISDALLGACALGDIGKHFPDTDEEYRGANLFNTCESGFPICLRRSFSFSSAQKPHLIIPRFPWYSS